MTDTTHLKLPFLVPSQAQKHVTVNESLAALDGLVHCAVLELARNDPPASPAEGDRYLVGPAPTGAWIGRAGQLAIRVNHGWVCRVPQPGWRVYNLADDTLYLRTTGGAWTPLSGGGGSATELQNATAVGIGTTADAANPFAAKLNAALFTARTAAEGGTGDLFVACNKSAEPRDAGFVFQSGFVTRAIAGLFGSNRFRVAVSADGAAFRDALVADDATGIVDQPRLPRFKAHLNFDQTVPADSWARIAINTTESNDQGAFAAATNLFTAPVPGTYCLGATLVFRQTVSSSARMRGRLVVNGTAEIPGSFGEISGAHISNATALWLQTLAPLAGGDTVALQGYFRGAEAAFAATQTAFWGFKIG